MTHSTLTAIRKGPRKHQLDLMRILFATLVLLSHAPEITDGNRSRELFTRLTHSPVSFGVLAVDGFFLLSGYLIVQSWDRDPELLNFLWKRVLRIVPGYLVAILLTVGAAGLFAPAEPGFFHHLGGRFAYSVLLLREPNTPPVFPSASLHFANGSLWTIFYEVHCYLLVALFGVFGLLRRRAGWVLGLAAMVVGLFSLRVQHLMKTHLLRPVFGSPESFLRLAAIFFVGGCFYLFRRSIPFRPALAWLSFATLIAARFLVTPYFEVPLVVFGAYLLFYLNDIAVPGLGWMARFPDISYGMYLYGWTVEMFWINAHPKAPWQAFFAATAICVVLGWLSWHLVERPMLQLKRRATAPLPAP